VLKAAQRAQREAHLGLGGERRVAAGEEQLEPLVGDCVVVVHALLQPFGSSEGPCGLGRLQQPGLCSQDTLAAQPVDGAIAARGDQPGTRVVRRALPRPPLGGDRERFLSGILGTIEVAEEADQGSEDPPPLRAEDLLDRGRRLVQG
jgi:hypothetical protein